MLQQVLPTTKGMARVFTITEGLENMGALKTGGQGSVYKGRRIGEIITAIKLLPTPIYSESADDKNFSSFQNEVQKLKKVNEIPNPNVVKILGSGITDTGNFPFIEMEYIEGPDLEELLQPPHEPVFTIKEALKVADQLSNALAHCHKVDVRHGDIKSNNVKFNTRTGTYILLDFGLSAMSDEARRTSLRRAGAIEFMAPEQNEGELLVQTDIYSFGIILFELLAGTVPFPLKDKGETARNNVMLAHMETPAPNLLALRQQHLPQHWSTQKQQSEMAVPDWLLNLVYRCLEKKPARRFANGIELHEYIWQNTIKTAGKNEWADQQMQWLQQENRRLQHENEQLKQDLSGLRAGSTPLAEAETTASYSAYDRTFASIDKKIEEPAYVPTYPAEKPGWVSRNMSLVLFLIIILIGGISYALINKVWVPKQADANVAGSNNSTQEETPRSVNRQYKVLAQRAYFYNKPDENTRRNAWAIPSEEIIVATGESDDFIYTEITNDRGQTSKGWLRKQDLITLEEARRQQQKEPEPNTEDQVAQRLEDARDLLNNGQTSGALGIYKELADQDVPEALYQYSNLALQNQNRALDCAQAFKMLKQASSKGVVPAKRTLGLLYSFADDNEILRKYNYYERCVFDKNAAEGSKLLIQAMVEGDNLAPELVETLNQKQRNRGDSAAQ